MSVTQRVRRISGPLSLPHPSNFANQNSGMRIPLPVCGIQTRLAFVRDGRRLREGKIKAIYGFSMPETRSKSGPGSDIYARPYTNTQSLAHKKFFFTLAPRVTFVSRVSPCFPLEAKKFTRAAFICALGFGSMLT